MARYLCALSSSVGSASNHCNPYEAVIEVFDSYVRVGKPRDLAEWRPWARRGGLECGRSRSRPWTARLWGFRTLQLCLTSRPRRGRLDSRCKRATRLQGAVCSQKRVLNDRTETDRRIARYGAALGDGAVQLIRPSGAVEAVQAHDGAALCLVVDLDGRSFVSRRDDGRLVRTAQDGSVAELMRAPGRQIDVLAVSRPPKARAVAVGREARLLGANGKLQAHVSDHLCPIIRAQYPSWPSTPRGSVSPSRTMAGSPCGGPRCLGRTQAV